MKTLFLPSSLLAAVLICGGHFHAQAQANGIFSSSPNGYSLSVGVTDTYNAGYTHSYVGFNAKRVSGAWTMGTDGANNGGTLVLGGITGELRFFTFPTANAGSSQNVTDAQINSMAPKMAINNIGQVRIGSTTPTGTNTDFLLSVAGKAVAQSIYVTNPTTWADFVFEPTYRFMSLTELEAYLQRNRHLPSMPSAAQVQAAGYSVSDMDAKLLQSVEELTLQVIALSKEVQQLKAQAATVK